MSGQTGQSLATFLLSVPVAAIGLMAVFGIPQFAAVIASQRGDEDAGEDPLDDLDVRDELMSESSDLFGGYDPAFPPASSEDDAPSWDRAAGESDNSQERTPRPGDVWGDRDSAFAETSQQGVDPASNSWGRTVAAATPTLTWSEARLQLSDLGVDDFHLEAGSVPDTFTFVAVFTPGDQPDVTYRFEAEASDPLLAVEDVVSQIEEWLADRFASTGQYRGSSFTSQLDRNW